MTVASGYEKIQEVSDVRVGECSSGQAGGGAQDSVGHLLRRRGTQVRRCPPKRCGEDPADGGCADPVAELEPLARWGYAHLRAVKRRCQRRTVPGVTSR